MIFSRIARSASRSARSRFEANGVLGGYGARGACLHELLVRSPPCRGTSSGSDGFGLLRSYLTSIGANKGFNGRKFFSHFNWVLVNPKFHRLFSSEAPKKKNYENFYPKKKTDVLKGNDNQKSESKGRGQLGVTRLMVDPPVVIEIVMLGQREKLGLSHKGKEGPIAS
ncbi:hypothetical protein H6P81_017934 [Aristolochia fimbriata]|uniref:Uncharacterized protein n=1 Tax=Aristolochia fimbriata TaxID=158543 RepID=A0AAV7DZK0_ARIFI|nr:hypothetical protein H6P81_017934 [Aristolochia fimbriata]